MNPLRSCILVKSPEKSMKDRHEQFLLPRSFCSWLCSALHPFQAGLKSVSQGLYFLCHKELVASDDNQEAADSPIKIKRGSKGSMESL